MQADAIIPAPGEDPALQLWPLKVWRAWGPGHGDPEGKLGCAGFTSSC